MLIQFFVQKNIKQLLQPTLSSLHTFKVQSASANGNKQS